MDVMHPRCCGLDVHAKFVTACRRIVGPGGRVNTESRRFLTTTAALGSLADWLAEGGVTHVAMESTGVFWKPIWNILEGRFTLLLVNARHVKQVPGRKTDVTDAEWLAQLLQHGLLQPSFVPDRPQRELRDLTRTRTKLIDQHTAASNRIRKVLEDANVKLGSVATDLLGVSARAMLERLAAGPIDPSAVAALARGRLREKQDALEAALTGHVTAHHRFQLRLLLQQLAFLEGQIAEVDREVAARTVPFEATIHRLDEIPGVDRRTAEILLAEVGGTVAPFPTPAHLASWAGICPGNHKTAGRQHEGPTRKGNRWLRRALTQAAWAATHAKKSYAAARFRRLVGRRGKKRALVAVAHTLLTSMYYVIAGADYHELGPTHLDARNAVHLTKYLVKRLQQLGHRVTLESDGVAA